MKSSAIAIVGMAGRFPGARNVSEFWKNLRDGRESIRDRSDEELRAAGATAEDLANPAYVKRASILDGVDLFDASFFGFSPRDASIMDPQHRHFLECAWEALEDAAHPPQSFDGAIGVFAGSGLNSYLIYNLLANRKMVESAGLFQLKQTGNDKDVLATRASYQFDLRGPSINVQTACSTSLVAVHLACQSLLNFECDMALAGGVTIEIPHGLGYLYREGEILARDGHCRSFDASSSGTVFGSGLGIVVLRRLEDAVASGDHIRAVILGSAINNDGSRKVGYLAPSVEGQVEVIREAMEFAGVAPADISYVETHGTGTVVGDPIEVRALTQAFRHEGTHSGSCAIGSVKSNVGHLDAAAGVTGLIKTVLALENAQLPPSLHFETLNPRIDLNGSPFFVNSNLAEWNSNGRLRRAGVTALGIGGTNAHVVLEEAPERTIKRVPKPYELLAVSAKSAAAADAALVNLVAHLGAHPEIDMGDAAWTSQVGRQAFAHRRALVVEDSPQALTALAEKGAKASATGVAPTTRPSVAFLFSGQGSQYVGMGHELYEHEPVFRKSLDRCARVLQPLIGIDQIKALYPADGDKDAAAEKLNQTWLTQPALFSIEYALAQWWMSLGIEPAAMVGHSIGEYVAACLAGVLSLDDALAVVAERGRLIYGLPAGTMLAVPLAADKLEIDASLSLAAINNPEMCVISGPTEAIAEFEHRMAEKSITCRRLYTSHAFHSSMMEPILSTFEEKLRGITLHAPQRPYLSNVTGTWIKPEEATNPAYWARHIRQTVRFSDCMAELLRTPGQILLEAGPGNVLTSLARAQGGATASAFQTLPHPRENVSGLRCALQTLGQLWVSGAEIDWTKLHPAGSTARVSLPTYPFEHHRYWVEPDRVRPVTGVDAAQHSPANSGGPRVYRRVWRPAPLPSALKTEDGLCVIFRDELGLGNEIATRLTASGREVVMVDPTGQFKRLGSDHYSLRPGVREDHDALVRVLRARSMNGVSFFHLLAVTPHSKNPAIDQALERSFFSPLYLAQALGAADVPHAKMLIASNELQQVFNEAVRDPERAILLGPAGVISKELPNIICRAVDLDGGASQAGEHATQLLTEMGGLSAGMPVAWRNGERFLEAAEAYDLLGSAKTPRIERGGVYLITGGLGALGLAVAEHLARVFKARLVLIGRTAVAEDHWEEVLNDPGASEDQKARMRKLIEIRSSAGGLLVAQADVTKLSQMQDVVAQTRKQFGRVDSVFHAAGVLDDGPLLMKSAEAAQRVLDPKVRGTLVLEEALQDAQLKCFVLFSSISAVHPPAGQVDYAAANAFLDAFARSRKGAVVSIDWDAWREAGMAASSAAIHPLLERRLQKTARDIVFATQLSIGKQWLLAEHRLKTGAALIPGTGYMEMAAGAFAAIGMRGAMELRDVFFLAPLSVGDRETKELRVQLHRDEAQSADFKFSILGQTSGTDKDAQWTEHSTGSIGKPSELSQGQVDHRSIAARCAAREMRFDGAHRTKQEQFFNFGPRWQCLKSLHIGGGEGLAEIELDARFASECESFQFHPPMLDLATGCALYLIDGYESFDDLYLPISYKRLRSYRPLPGHFFSHIRSRKENRAHGDFATFDITLMNEHNEVLAEIDGFAMRRISDPSAAANEELSRHATMPMPVTDSDVEATGIATRDGIEILQRVLVADIPSTLIVAQRDMEAFVGAQGNGTAVSAVAPTPLASEDAGDVEATLCAWFKELLGVDGVALDDDFFALGGHSLVGVRLFAKIRNAYQVDLELAALFEHRTVRSLAERIRSMRLPAATEPKGTCLIAIQPKGSRPPIFFVHAVGGEVLYYEPLTRALGNDQPFYAFQSKLANQAQIGPTSMEELATAYLSELRKEFPPGPYILGGHSYGGLVAFEMAQQLAAEGLAPHVLIMLDAYIPGCSERLTRSAQWANLRELLRRDGMGYLVKKANAKRIYLGERFVRKLRLLACAGYRIAHRRLPASLRYFMVEEMHFRALWAYSFRPYPGDMQLIRATDCGVGSLSERRDPKLGWGAVVQGELTIYDVDADHSNIVSERYVQTVADKIQQIIRTAGTSAGPHSAKKDPATAASSIPEDEVLVAHQ
jgi:acyl transferase domain-containing protein/thioesterase domain-containing protein/acyl carrier protein